MSQTIVNYAASPSGAELLDDMLAKEQENILTLNSGTARPSYAQAGTMWINTSSTSWVLNVYDGSDDIPLGTINASNNIFTPTNPLTNTGDLFVRNASGVTRLPAGSVADTVLTSNGSNALPSYKKPPIGIYSYSSDRTYSINDVVVSAGTSEISLYRSKVNNNKGKALTNTTYWEAENNVKLTGNQTIAGVKTFSSSPVIPTVAVTDNSTKSINSAFINNKFKTANSVPSTFTEGVWLAIFED